MVFACATLTPTPIPTLYNIVSYTCLHRLVPSLHHFLLSLRPSHSLCCRFGFRITILTILTGTVFKYLELQSSFDWDLAKYTFGFDASSGLRILASVFGRYPLRSFTSLVLVHLDLCMIRTVSRSTHLHFSFEFIRLRCIASISQ